MVPPDGTMNKSQRWIYSLCLGGEELGGLGLVVEVEVEVINCVMLTYDDMGAYEISPHCLTGRHRTCMDRKGLSKVYHGHFLWYTYCKVEFL